MKVLEGKAGGRGTAEVWRRGDGER